MPESDNRTSQRVSILGELQGEIMVFQAMLLRDISKGGATIETRFPLHLESLHDIRLTLGAQSIVVKARVAHSRISEVDQDIVTYRSGLEFIAVSGRALEAIREFMQTVQGDRTGV